MFNIMAYRHTMEHFISTGDLLVVYKFTCTVLIL